MGNFYVNFTVRGPSQKQVIGYLKYAKRTAYIGPTERGMTVIFDQQADSQDVTIIERFAEDISRAFSTPVFTAAGHDNDLFVYWFFENGQLLDEYDSWPGYFEGERNKPDGGDAAALCAAFQKPDRVREVNLILRQETYRSAEERHRDLARVLDLPLKYVNDGYQSIEANRYQEQDESLVHVG